MSEITPAIRIAVQEFKSRIPRGGYVRLLIDTALQTEAFSDSDSYTGEAVETAEQVILDVYNELTFGEESNIYYDGSVFNRMIDLVDTKSWYTTNHN